jgi:hypothetical protein
MNARAALASLPLLLLALLGLAPMPHRSAAAAPPATAVAPAAAPAALPPDFTGLWQGLIVYRPAESEFDLVVDIFRDATGALAGTVDLPSERIRDRPLRNVAVDGRRLSMEFLNDSEVRGPNAVFRLEGELAGDGASMRGAFVEAGGRMPFVLERRGEPGSERPPETRSPITVLSAGGDELKAAFNREAGRVRLVLLLSPT